MPGFDGPLAQLVEQKTFNLLVDGSNPSRPTIQSVLALSLCHFPEKEAELTRITWRDVTRVPGFAVAHHLSRLLVLSLRRMGLIRNSTDAVAWLAMALTFRCEWVSFAFNSEVGHDNAIASAARC